MVFIFCMVNLERARPHISDISSRSVLLKRGSLSMSLVGCSRTLQIHPSFHSLWRTRDVSMSLRTVRTWWLLMRMVSEVMVFQTSWIWLMVCCRMVWVSRLSVLSTQTMTRLMMLCWDLVDADASTSLNFLTRIGRMWLRRSLILKR